VKDWKYILQALKLNQATKENTQIKSILQDNGADGEALSF